jgi:D-alanine-D-alanine ligase-like ATP-grasp enzyme
MEKTIEQLKIAVLAGGVGAEREVSLQSGKNIYNALLEGGVNAVQSDITMLRLMSFSSRCTGNSGRMGVFRRSSKTGTCVLPAPGRRPAGDHLISCSASRPFFMHTCPSPGI